MLAVMQFSEADWTALARLRATLRSGEAQRLRLDAGMSMGEVARRIGTNASVVLRWERGERVPADRQLSLRYWRLLQQLRRMTRAAVS